MSKFKVGDKVVGNEKANPYTEPEQPKEPIVLFCVKDYINGSGDQWLKKGKTYDVVHKGKYDYLIYETWESMFGNFDFEKYCKNNPAIAECLVPLVKRPAKVGEWVLPNDDGKICEVKFVGSNGGVDVKGGHKSMWLREYEVLDGYTPEPEKEPEPVHYSGKVVCTENENTKGFWTVGKVYEFKNGYAMTDCGEKSPVYGAPINALSEYAGVKFIPYLGEA